MVHHEVEAPENCRLLVRRSLRKVNEVIERDEISTDAMLDLSTSLLRSKISRVGFEEKEDGVELIEVDDIDEDGSDAFERGLDP